MKCEREQCPNEIPEIVLVPKGSRAVVVTIPLSELARAHHIFCSEDCQRRKYADDWKREHPQG